jgi:hypothetical protein
METDITVYDPLDLVSHRHDDRNVADDIRTGTTQLALTLLRGWTPVVSQTQAFDSRVIIEAALDGTPGAAQFRWLIQEGHIHVPLFQKPTLCDAFIAALNNTKFVFLYWPEVMGVSPAVTRQEVVEVLRQKHPASKLPPDLARKIETIRALSSALEKSRVRLFARPPSVALSDMLQQAKNKLETQGSQAYWNSWYR